MGVNQTLPITSIFYQENWPAVASLCSPMVLNFLWGILIAEAFTRKLHISCALASVMTISGLAIVFAFPHEQLLGAQYALLVAGVVFLESKLAGRIPRIVRFGGDASYSLYLVHPMVGVFVALALSKLHVQATALSVLCIIIASLVGAAITYVYFEKPTTRYLKRRFLARAVHIPVSDNLKVDQQEDSSGMRSRWLDTKL